MTSIFISGGTEIFSNNIDLLVTTSSTVGVITKGGTRFIHDYLVNNVFAGTGAGNFTMTGTHNSALGYQTLQVNTSGSNNTVIGYQAMSASSSGGNNIAIGSSAGSGITTNSNNIVIGNVGNAVDSGVMRFGTSGTHVKAFISGVTGITPDTADGAPLYIGSAGQFGTVGTPAPPALTATQVAYGSAGNIMTSTTTLEFTAASNTLTIGNPLGGGNGALTIYDTFANTSFTYNASVLNVGSGLPGIGGNITIRNTAGNVGFSFTPLSSTLNLGPAGVGGGLILNNATASYTPATLNYYETVTVVTTISGSWVAKAFTYYITRLGQIVTIYWAAPVADVATVNNVALTVATVVPTRFLPRFDTPFMISVFDTNYSTIAPVVGNLTLYVTGGPAGQLSFLGYGGSGSTGTFSAIGQTVGVMNGSISYSV